MIKLGSTCCSGTWCLCSRKPVESRTFSHCFLFLDRLFLTPKVLLLHSLVAVTKKQTYIQGMEGKLNEVSPQFAIFLLLLVVQSGHYISLPADLDTELAARRKLLKACGHLDSVNFTSGQWPLINQLTKHTNMSDHTN